MEDIIVFPGYKCFILIIPIFFPVVEMRKSLFIIIIIILLY